MPLDVVLSVVAADGAGKAGECSSEGTSAGVADGIPCACGEGGGGRAGLGWVVLVDVDVDAVVKVDGAIVDLGASDFCFFCFFSFFSFGFLVLIS